MAHIVVIAGLTERASEIRGQIAVLEGQIAKHRADLAHVMATLRLFDPTAAEKRVRVKRPARPRATYFATGEIARRCRNALRDADGPISADDIAFKAMREKGLDPADGALRADMSRRLLWALHKLGKDGKAKRLGGGASARWALPNR